MTAERPQKLAFSPDETWEKARPRLGPYFTKLDSWMVGQGTEMWKEIDFTGGSTDVTVLTRVVEPATGVSVEFIEVKDTHAAPTAAFSLIWTVGDQSVVIRSIPGLVSGTVYRIRLLIRWAG